MSERNRVIKFWSGAAAAERSYPKHRGRWPDNDHIEILARLCLGHVCEVGCGTGRCADAFDPWRYVGVDINLAATVIAKNEKPQHQFLHVAWDDPYPKADTYLFHTAMMHIPDDELDGVVKRCSGRIVIAECMMSAYRRPEITVFNRDPQDYTDLLQRHGFYMQSLEEHPTNYQTGRKDLPPLKRRFMVAVSGAIE
jgi:SAM-dependent methyltransferase